MQKGESVQQTNIEPGIQADRHMENQVSKQTDKPANKANRPVNGDGYQGEDAYEGHAPVAVDEQGTRHAVERPVTQLVQQYLYTLGYRTCGRTSSTPTRSAIHVYMCIVQCTLYSRNNYIVQAIKRSSGQIDTIIDQQEITA